MFFKQTIHTSSSPYSHKSGTLSRHTAQDHPPGGGNYYPTERKEWNQEMWLWWPCCHVSSSTFFPLNCHGNETYMAKNTSDQIPNRLHYRDDFSSWFTQMIWAMCLFLSGVNPQHFRLINQGITGSPSSNCPSVHGSVPHPLGRLFRHGDVDGTLPVDGWWS